MSKRTPEGIVKTKLLNFLKSKGYFYYTPVQQSIGGTGIPDIMACINGVTVALECKATGKLNPTVKQALQLERIHKSKGVAWVVDIDNADDAIYLINTYESDLRDSLPSETLLRWKKMLMPTGFNNGYTC